MKIKNYLQFIKEDITEQNINQEDDKKLDFSEEKPTNKSKKSNFDISSYEELKDEIQEMIKKSLKESTRSNEKDFIKEYLRDNDGAQIEGLINDSDVYEFYLKYRNDIDDILSNIGFFDKSSSSLEVFSLYDYIIEGTKEAVKKIIENI